MWWTKALTRLFSLSKFNSSKPLHRRLVQLGHEASERQGEAVGQIEGEIDEAAAELWDITPKELGEIQRSLAELLGDPAPTSEQVGA